MKYQTDIAATNALYADGEGWCDCIYCRNYILTLPEYHPDAVKKLENLGLRHDRALEIMEYGPDDTGNKRIYEAYYPVIGSLSEDALTIYDQDAVITLYQHDSPKLFCPSPKVEKPYFMAVLSVTLPWEMEPIN